MKTQMLVALMAVAMLSAVSSGAVIVNSDSYYFGFDTTTDVSSATAGNALATDFNEGDWLIGTDGTGTSQRWYLRVPTRDWVAGDNLRWELTFDLVPGREITSVSIDYMYFQIGKSSVGAKFKAGFGYVDSLGQDVVVKELLGVNNTAKTATIAGQMLPGDVAGMTSLTLFGYAEAIDSQTNFAGQGFQFARGSSTNGNDFEVTLNTQVVPEPATIVLMGLASLGIIARRRQG